MSNPARLAALVAISLACSFAHPALAANPKTWNKSFTVTAHPRVQLRAGDGRVRIHVGADGGVQAEVRYKVQHWGFTSPSRDPQVLFEQTGNTVNIEVREPSVFAVFGAVSEDISIDVTVPADVDLAVHTADGSVTLESPVRGSVEIGTGDGRVTLRGARGQLRLSTGDGAIDATGVDGSVTAHAGDGQVHLDGRFDAIDVRSADGHVVVTARPGSQLASDWRLETADASLSLSIPRDLKADLDARTGDGRIHFDLPVTISGRLDPHVVRGRLNGGGPLLRMRTADGSLTLAVTE